MSWTTPTTVPLSAPRTVHRVVRGRPTARAARFVTTLVALVAALTVSLSGLLGASVAPAQATTDRWAAQEHAMVEDINATRRAEGLRPLAVDAELTELARGWSAHMDGYNRLFHHHDMGDHLTYRWARVAENIGTFRYGSDIDAAVEKLHRAFVNSSGHRKNILGDHNAVGVGIFVDDGVMWVTVDFAKKV